jgi:ABC-2 type transport system ATP-binding protein
VLDEPGNGLDPQGIHALRNLLRERADAGHTIFTSRHFLAEVDHLADDGIILDHGRLAMSGPLNELQTKATPARTSATRCDGLAPQDSERRDSPTDHLLASVLEQV